MQPWWYFFILVMPPHTLWLIYLLFTAFHTDAICMAWQARALWPEAGTGHLGHKLKTSRSQNITAVSPLHLLPWPSLEARSQGVAGYEGSVVPKSLPSCPAISVGPGQLMTVLSILDLMVLSTCRASLETCISGWLAASGLLYPGGWRELDHCCWLSAISLIFCPFSMDWLRRGSLWGWSR